MKADGRSAPWSGNAKVGAAIAVHNAREVLGDCLRAGGTQWSVAVVVDDGSTDGTSEWLRRSFPEVDVVASDGSLWWAGGTNAAIERCLALGCSHVLLLNPDVEVASGCIAELLKVASPTRIAASLVTIRSRPDRIAWAGSTWGQLRSWLPIYTSRYIARRGAPVAAVGRAPYRTSEVHGRAVLVTRETFERIGLLDAATFPQYGGDNDFSLRAEKAGIEMYVVPTAQASLRVDNSGMRSLSEEPFLARLRGVARYLTDRRRGDGLRVWWHLLTRHVPAYAVAPTFAWVIALNVVRRLFPARARVGEG